MSIVCFIDTETDGVRPDRRVWEVSIIRQSPAEPTEEATLIIADAGVTGAEEPKALEINRYWDRVNRTLQHPELRLNGFRAAHAIQEVTRDATLVGAQPQFDAHGLERLLRWYGLEPQWKRRLRCVESMAMGWTGAELGGLAECAAAVGIEVPQDELHTSYGDAKLCREIWNEIMSKPSPQELRARLRQAQETDEDPDEVRAAFDRGPFGLTAEPSV